MKLVADEGIDRAIVDRLRAQGHDVVYIAESEPSVDDDRVLQIANDLRAVLVTADKDFGELVFRQRRAAHGIVLIRLAGLAEDTKAKVVATALHDHGQEMTGAFSVVSPSVVRIRRGAGTGK